MCRQKKRVRSEQFGIGNLARSSHPNLCTNLRYKYTASYRKKRHMGKRGQEQRVGKVCEEGKVMQTKQDDSCSMKFCCSPMITTLNSVLHH